MAGKKQEISVPFCWEEVPGTPKRNWNKPTTTKTSIEEPPIKLLPLPPPPYAAAKSTVSIPFKWEEKPGTPLPFFSQHHQSSSSSYDQDESESPVSQFSDSDSDCYESGGEEGLIEWMFPLSSTRSSHLEKTGCHEKWVQKVGGMNEGKVFDEMKYSTTVEIKRPLLTLGEMIMMSKRRSYQKKILDMHSQSFTKETKKRKAFLSCIKGLMKIILSKPHMNWTKQQKLKLMQIKEPFSV